VPVQALEGDAPRASRRTASWSTGHATVYTEWCRKGEGGRHAFVRWLWRCPDADASCHRRGRLVAVATGGGAAPAAASRHSDSLTALHPPTRAPGRSSWQADWMTGRSRARSSVPPQIRFPTWSLPLPPPPTGGAGGGTRGSTVRPAINCPASRAGARATVRRFLVLLSSPPTPGALGKALTGTDRPRTTNLRPAWAALQRSRHLARHLSKMASGRCRPRVASDRAGDVTSGTAVAIAC